MKNYAYQFISRVRQQATPKKTHATITSGGRERTFVAYDWGTDTFIFERDVWKLRPERAPVVILCKDALIEGREGRIMCVTSGSHSVAAIPLLKGLFWNLGRIAEKDRGEVMTKRVVCANFVGDNIEISQRDVSTEEIFETDEWLRGLGWSLTNVVIAERTDGALERYRRLGQEWRIKPLVWTRAEMDFALAAAQTHIHSRLSYYHNVKGVHFLAYEDFAALAPLCLEDFDAAKACVAELVRPAEVGDVPALRDHKFHGHHEIELFGIRDPQARDRVVDMLEKLGDYLADPAAEPAEAARRLEAAGSVFRSSLSFPDLADKSSDLFVSSMYKHLTGEIYSGTQDQIVPAFDDRRTALPGVTYRGDRHDVHPGADDRTRAIIDYAESRLSHGEVMEYVNVYELRLNDNIPLGKGPTREIEFKTNRRPVPVRLLEKRLAHQGIEYANYMLARVQAFQALGIAFVDHHLLSRQERAAGDACYFLRKRCPGYALNSISRNRFQRPTGADGVFKDFPEAILMTAAQAGRAAAQTMIVKKYVPGRNPVHFNEGKEIVEFGYDLNFRCEMPVDVRLCSIRGTLGWPCIDKTPENMEVCIDSYAEAFAAAVVRIWHEHSRAVTLDQVVKHFNEGFSSCTREIYWNYASQRELFNQFDPGLRAIFKFVPKWSFILWALRQQYEQLDRIAAQITAYSGELSMSHDEE
ncbi:MAG: hypothetical protein IJQ73_00955 [Kiritimatiellae bacterium]|nr:hypothetical protein [Kiritimatiellia bacterium]